MSSRSSYAQMMGTTAGPMLGEASSRLLQNLDLASQGFVYVVVSCDHVDGPVKIGWAVDPRKRLVALQTGTPHELRLVDVLPGGRRAEAAFHAQLREERIRGEWFGGESTRQFVALVRAASTEALACLERHGEMPTEDDVLDAMGIEIPAERDRALYEEIMSREPIVWDDPDPIPPPDPNYIVVGETAGPPPRPTGHIPYQRPMGRRIRRGSRGGMK